MTKNGLSRRDFLGMAALGAASSFLPGCKGVPARGKGAGGAEGGKRPPNILFILVDDMGWKDAGFMGSEYYETPNMDRLAKEGMVFTQAYTCGPNCAPSRASILTGEYTPRHGIYTVGNSARGRAALRKLIPIKNTTILARKFVTFAEALKPAHYRSASMGKWHMGDDPEFGPRGQGFDVNVGGWRAGHPRSYFSPYHNPALKDGPKGEYLTDRLTEEALKFIEENRNRPFLLYLPHYAVHTPLQAKKAMIEKYKKKKPSHGQHNPVYAAMVESVDQGVGRILDKLRELGLEENTVVILSSDNGGVRTITSQEPLRGGKGMLYEGGIRVPMIVRRPGKVKAGSVCDTPVIGVDFLPTFLEIAGVPKPKDLVLDGVSLVPLLEGRKIPERPLFWHFPAYLQGRNVPGARDPFFRTRPCGVVRKGRWKLIEYFEDHALELYDLESDIGESHNLAASRPGKVKELMGLMKAWRKEVKAPVPTRLNPRYDPKAAARPRRGRRRRKKGVGR